MNHVSSNQFLIQSLANYEHDRWSRWQEYLFRKCIVHNDGSVTIPTEYVNRWKRQMKTEYHHLSEEEKASDRKEAVIILKLIEEWCDNHE